MKQWLIKVVVTTMLLSCGATSAGDPGAEARAGDPPGRTLCDSCARPEYKDLAHCKQQAASPQTSIAVVPATGGDFVLTSATGPVDLVNLRGQVVLIYFGYTWCPDICPTNLVMIASALKSLQSEELARVQVLFVSVDPERDDVQRLAQYAAYFHPKILGVTGAPEALANIAARYGASFHKVEQPDSAMGYAVDHSAETYVLGQDGRLVHTLDHATPSSEILALIRDLLIADSS